MHSKWHVRVVAVGSTGLSIGIALWLASRCAVHAGFQTQVGHLGFESPQTNPLAVSPDGSTIYVCNTPNDTLSIIDAETRTVVREVPVGLQPVSVAVRPDGAVVYVSNHLSDSVSAVDPTAGIVVATIQDVAPSGDPDAGLTRFDEPCQVAFSPDGTRAYVALSHANQVAVIDAQAHRLIGRIDLDGGLSLPGGEMVALSAPHALALLDGGRYLAVAAFESGNRTELQYQPGFPGSVNPGVCNGSDDMNRLRTELLSNDLDLATRGDVVQNPAIPDRDVVVVRTSDGQPVAMLHDVGTLLYGLAAVPGSNLLAITHTDARNTANGFAALGHRPWLNRVSGVAFHPGTERFGQVFTNDLDAPIGGTPDPALPAAVPYGLAFSPDGSTCWVTAAGSDRLLVLTSAGAVLHRVAVGSNPTGVAFDATRNEVWVLDRIDGTVSIVDATSSTVVSTISIGASPVADDVKRGARVVHGASFSGNGSVACASCHPAGNVDQLEWDLGGRDPNGVDIVGPRVTMPLRGLDGTARFHWDGVFDTLHDLVVGTVTGNVMSGTIDDALATDAETYLRQIPHFPGPHRRPSDALSADAANGLAGFVGLTCAQSGCHEAPFWTSFGELGNGIEAVSVRALQDRRQLGHDGVSSNLTVGQCYGLYHGRIDSEMGERSFLFTFFDLDSTAQTQQIAFYDETSTGLPGVLGAQATVSAANVHDAATHDLFLRVWRETSAGKALLTADGSWNGVVHLEWDGATRRFVGPSGSFPFASLARAVRHEGAVLTFTARLARAAEQTQPDLLEVRRDAAVSTFGQVVDVPASGTVDLTLIGRHFQTGARCFVDGVRTATDPAWIDDTRMTLHLAVPAGAAGSILAIDVQNPMARFSNELPLRRAAAAN
jgi:YVTN family beta-propeller protein